MDGVVRLRGQKIHIAGIYELNESQKKSLLNDKPVIPQSFICQRAKAYEQGYYRGYCRDNAELNKAKRVFIDTIN